MVIAHRGPVSGVAASDQYIATAGYDNQILLWDPQSRTPLSRAFHDHLANQCTFSPDGRFLLSASSDYSARLWTVPELRLVTSFGGHTDDVEMVAIDPTGSLVATASRDHKVRLFGVDGRQLATLIGHEADVISVIWNGSDELISSSDDGTVRFWDVSSHRLIRCIELGGVETDTVALGPSGVVFAGTDEGDIVTLAAGARSRKHAHQSGVKRLTVSPDQKLLVSSSYDRRVAIWNVGHDGEITLHSEATIPELVWPRSCAFFRGGRVVFGTFGTGYAMYSFGEGLWDLGGVRETPGLNAICTVGEDEFAIGDAGVLLRNGIPTTHLGSLCNFLTPFQSALLTGGQSGMLFDGISGAAYHTHTSPLNCATAYDLNGVSWAVVGTYTGEALVFRWAHGRPQFERMVRLHSNAIKGLANNGAELFSVCATGDAAIHDLETLSLKTAIPKAHAKIANGCSAGPDGGFLSVGRDLQLRMWNHAGDSTAATPHTHSIKCVAASRDGRLIATGAYDGRIAVYNPAQRYWPIRERPTTAGISNLWATDTMFVASSYDGNVYRIPMPFYG